MTPEPPKMVLLGQRVFSVADQIRFAEVSGDFNPMHVDAVAARRLITGRQVVHGIHLLLLAIEYWRGQSMQPLRSIACSFNNPVSVGDTADFIHCQDGEVESTLEVLVSGLTCARITLGTDMGGGSSLKDREGASCTGLDRVFDPSRRSEPLNESPESHLGKRCGVRLARTGLEGMFPQSCAAAGHAGVASLLGLSYMVGMASPGLHSVFSSLKVELSDHACADEVLRFAVAKYDHRFRLMDIDVDGCLRGSVRAFVRPPPQSQPSVESLFGLVGEREFSGSRALVLGGSRGLGELVAKAIAAGGGDVVITYATGAADAAAICRQIMEAGRGSARSAHLDLDSARFADAGVEWHALDSIYYFATPRIFRKKADVFDPALFRELCDFYITRLYQLCVFLEASAPPQKIRVYFPSTVFIDERPKGLAEYAMAKAAAEVLVQDVNKAFTAVSLVCTRLPRLSTDQTSGIVTTKAVSNVDTILELVRLMHS